MALKNSEYSYGALSQLLHWSVAALIVTQYVLAQLAERAEDSDARLAQLALLANHKSVGITILGLALLRIVWRLISPPPEMPATMPAWQILVSKISHRLLYVLLFALPITGWLMSSASAYPVSWFKLFQLPDLVAPSETLKDIFLDAHRLLAELLFVLASLHIAAALKHHWLDKDDILKRMSSPASIGTFAVLLTATLWIFATVGGNEINGDSAAAAGSIAVDSETSEQAAAEGEGAGAANKPPAWDIDYSASHIKFTAEQAGAKFTGAWPSWRADMHFAADALQRSSFDVRIDVTKVDSRDGERDAALMEPEWFDTEKFPEARFVTRDFKSNPDGSFTAEAELTIKDLASPVEFTFNVTESDEKIVLQGSARLDRLALRVGTGEWTDLEWVGQFVDVEVRVEADALR